MNLNKGGLSICCGRRSLLCGERAKKVRVWAKSEELHPLCSPALAWAGTLERSCFWKNKRMHSLLLEDFILVSSKGQRVEIPWLPGCQVNE